jgi:N-acetylglucosamine-6-phosphate deacetylase
MNYTLHHFRLVSPGMDFPNAALHVVDGKIAAVFADAGSAQLPPGPCVDLGGKMLVPGFIDIHSHGAGGADVTDGSAASLETIARCKLAEGVTTWLPTTLTLPQDDLARILQAVEEFRLAGPPLSVPGIHLEGPYINPNCAGAQNPAYVQLPNIADLEKLADITPISVLSLATEMPGGVEMARWASQRGIACSLAHTAATYADFLAAKAAGLRHLTHFCNQMTPLHHREIGIVGAGLLDDSIRLELICDGIHLSPEMIRLVFATKPLRQLMLITDSIAASHLGDGNYVLGGLDVTVQGGAARLGSGALAGSTLRYADGLRRVSQLTQLPLQELLATTALNQAESLGLTDRGKIAPGYRADFALLDADFAVQGTWVAGQRVFGG